ncbi:hypothetical protein DRN44_00140 [Thermococci archaeon]|nr:MAG: hypothetical protein DRN44_00140 [Thermococci archaeon]
MIQKRDTTVLIHRFKEYGLKGLVEITKRNNGEWIFLEEWDHLIILDDCRYDVFREEFKRRGLPGTLKPKNSLGSWTGEFLRRNFREKHPEIVFVSANPFSDVYLKNKFYKLISVWKTEWDDRYQTVPPGAVYRAALKAARRHPDKKLVIHFLQPHHPYFSLNFRDKTMTLIRESIEGGHPELDTIKEEPINTLYLSPIYGQFHIKHLIWAYKENLRLVIPYVELLLHKLAGKTVVTSDHGELFGENVLKFIPIKVYGHGIGRNPNLVTVPWWVVTDEDREDLRPIKDIKKEIATIESRFGLTERSREKRLLKKAISRLRHKKNLTMLPESMT